MLCGLSLSTRADAQRAGPDAADPSEIRPRVDEVAPERRVPRDRPEVELTRPPDGLAAPAAVVAFTLGGVTVDGATVFDAAEFVPVYEPYLGSEVGEAEVAEIVAGIQALYRDRGYFLTRVVAPPQDATLGVLRLQVIEGYVESVIVAGGDGAGERLAGFAKPITAQRPLTRSVLERQLILISDQPGVSVTAAIDPVDDAAGAYVLHLDVAIDAVRGTAYLDNRGTRAVGRLEGLLGAGLNDLLGLGEGIEGLVFTVPDDPSELVFGQVGYLQPIGVDGLTVALTAAGSLSEPGGDLKRFDIESSSASLSARVTYPLVRTREQSVWLYGAFNLLNSRAESAGTTFLKDRLRVARIGVDYLQSDAWQGTTRVGLAASQGLNVLNASGRGDPLLSRTDGRADFTKLTAELTRRQAIVERLAVVASASGQYSTVPLLSAEEFSVGGSRFGRAFDFAELKGEHGVAASVEVQFGDQVDWDLLSAYQLFAFWDTGSVWNEQAGRGAQRESLMSAGGGVRLAVTDSIQLAVEVSKPFRRTPANEGDRGARVFFSVSSGL